MKIVIIDDEPNATEALEQMIRMVAPQTTVVGIANSAHQGIELIQQHTPDLVLLDIQMPHMTGFEMLEKLGKINFAVIFTTAYDQYALRAFKVSATDYLLKPIDLDELETAIQKVRDHIQSAQPDFKNIEQLFRQINQPNTSQRIALPTADGLIFVAIDKIVRLQSDSNYTTFFMENNQKILVSRTLGDYESLLDKQRFCRIHHSHLINLNHLNRYIKTDGGYAEMSDGSKIEISRRKKDEFLARLGDRFMG